MLTAVRTDIGRIRAVNEDRALVTPDLNGLVFAIVADGMGGHQAGDTASQMAVELIHEGLQQVQPDASEEERKLLLHEAIQSANRQIYEVSRSRQQFSGMGTTVVALLATEQSLTIANIGDSRAYLRRNDKLIRLTEDHSLVYELMKSGQLTAEEAENHPRRNVLTRALGTDPDVEADICVHNWEPGDIILVCSDGLSTMATDTTLLRVLQGDGDLGQIADSLILTALEAGGDDNITVVLLKNAPGDTESKG
ncbi:Stp1/IreP family PP2C-type Ser/Thr phosphatase [Gorillibacterium massiliense]|uniref:Stp1/IreP family PP2C-type Ser/Thr phosphatase n=1 Tax=Gorillibacterium massiliense TaxID=1280390 RepID=UPI0004BCDA21|nr:Stp1/IreP family PP2C-type Ser/Thr phosphatase [Gorillibacterium massiliense]